MLSAMEPFECAGGGGYGPPPGGGGYGPPPGGGYPPPGGGGYPPPGGGGYGPPGGYPPPAGGPPGPPQPGNYAIAPGAPYGIEPRSGLPYSDKQKLVVGLLQLMFPGVGRIYAGYTGIGIAQLVSLFFCVGGIWGIVDAVLILSGKVPDAEGKPLRE